MGLPGDPKYPSRREFLIRCCQAAALAPVGLHHLRFPYMTGAGMAGSPFHLHPHYRSELPLETILRQLNQDAFPSEKLARRIQRILAEWSQALRHSPNDLRSIEASLAPDFLGAGFPAETTATRSGPRFKVTTYKQANSQQLHATGFLRELQSWLTGLTPLTADFQITGIDLHKPGEIHTRVRYELVGEGQGFYREQRIGYWDLTWREDSSGGFRVRQWVPKDETRSASLQPLFVDATADAFGSNLSYSQQLLHGTDYWRSILDVACGIDIYGHNGVSVGDIDGDGFDDIYICQPGGLPNRLYRNRRDGTFEDITESAGVGILENTACALFLDVNNTGRQDLVVVRADGPMLFLNQGRGTFRHQPNAFRFASPPQGTFTGAAAADYDRDGWLDIYFCLYVYYQGTDQYKYPSPYFDAENGPPNFLMRNNRDGSFHDVTAETGLHKNNTRYSFCCAWNDYNQDGWPDLYVVNDFGRKNLYRNNGDGTFTDVAREAGVEDVGAGMSVCWADYDNDAAADLYVADMWTAAGERITAQPEFKKDSRPETRALYRKHAMGNSLFHNSGQRDGAFQDRTAHAGAGMGRWAWSSDTWDFDHDGFADLYIANGMISGPETDGAVTEWSANENDLFETDLNSFFWQRVVASSPDQPGASREYEQAWNAINELIRTDRTWSGYERNVFYANNGDGTFSDLSGAAGLDFMEDGRSFALADLDHDGRLELLLKNRNSPQIRLVRNAMENLPPAIAFCLNGTKSNRDAIGAVVTVETDTGKQMRSVQAGSGFLSQHSKEVFFGLGTNYGRIKAGIRWPSGLVQEFTDLAVNHRIWIEEGSAPSKLEPFVASPKSRGTVTASRQPEQLPTTFETWLLSPMDAPDFSASDIGGHEHKFSAYRGKPVLLNFWISTAPACQQDLQTLARSAQRWAADGLQLLTVNFDDVSRGNTPAMAANSYAFPVLRGSDDLAGVYSIVYRHLFDRRRDLLLPTSWLINSDGEIVKIYVGPLNAAHVSADFRHIPNDAAGRLAIALPFPGISDSQLFPRNYLTYGSVNYQRGYMEQAEEAFSRAVRTDPSSAEAQYGLGSVYLNQEKLTDASQCFQHAIQLNATYPDTLPNAWNNLGLIAAREGRVQEGISDFQQALRLSPDHVVALDNLGNAYRQLKQWEQSKEIFGQSLRINPQDPEANYGLGMIFAETNDTDRAYEFLRKALQSRPAYPEALNNLGILYLRTHRRDQAVASFKECIRVAPLFEQAYLNLARVYAIEGTPEGAKSVLLDLLKQRPTDEAARKMLAELGK